MWSPVDSIIGVTLSVGILILLAVVAVNMMLLLVSSWLLMYAGIFFLGFGGSRWTSDMAINYYKTVLSVAVQIMTIVLLVGIGNDLLSSFYAKMNTGTLNFEELGVMLVFCVTLLMLIKHVPPQVAGVISGTSVGNVGNFGAGAALGAAGMAAAAVATAGAALAAGAASAVGGASAVMAAFSKARESMSMGTDLSGGGSSGGDSGGSAGGTGDTPFAQAAGFSGSSDGGSSLGNGGGPSTDTSAGSSKVSDNASAGGQSSSSTSTGNSGDKTANNEPKPTGGSAQSQQAVTGRKLASAASALGTAGRIAAAVGANLAKGTADGAKAKAASMREAAAERIADTTGGKIAAAIRAQGSGTADNIDMPDKQPTPSFGDNSLAAETEADPDAEIAAFTNRDHGSNGATE